MKWGNCLIGATYIRVRYGGKMFFAWSTESRCGHFFVGTKDLGILHFSARRIAYKKGIPYIRGLWYNGAIQRVSPKMADRLFTTDHIKIINII